MLRLHYLFSDYLLKPHVCLNGYEHSLFFKKVTETFQLTCFYLFTLLHIVSVAQLRYIYNIKRVSTGQNGTLSIVEEVRIVARY